MDWNALCSISFSTALGPIHGVVKGWNSTERDYEDGWVSVRSSDHSNSPQVQAPVCERKYVLLDQFPPFDAENP